MKQSHIFQLQTNQKKVRRKYRYRKWYKESNLEEQNFEEEILKIGIVIFW